MNNEKEIIFWGAGTARTFRPIWMAEELGISYKLNPIGPRTGETQTKKFTSINRKQKIPLMQIGEFYLSESLAICRYLQRAFPSKNLFIPTSDEELAKEDEWCNFIYGELDETSLYVMRRHYDLKKIYGDAPEVVKSCREYFEKQLGVVEDTLSQNGTLFGLEFGLADILLTSCLDWAVAYEFELPENIYKYHKRITVRDAYIKAVEINYKS